MRLRGDLVSYLQDLRLSGRFNSELVRLVLAHTWQQQEGRQTKATSAAVTGGAGGGRADLYRQFVARERDAAKTRRRHAQLVASHQQLRRDYQKLIAVTKELTSGLEMVAKAAQQQQRKPASAAAAARGIGGGGANTFQSIQWDVILGNCSRIYPELFPPPPPPGQADAGGRRRLPALDGDYLEGRTNRWTQQRRQSASSSASSPTYPLDVMPESIADSSSSTASSSYSRLNAVTSAFISSVVASADGVAPARALDFAKIKSDLAAAEVPRRKLLLIQALRWVCDVTVSYMPKLSYHTVLCKSMCILITLLVTDSFF